jgi:hypothetical protein
MFFQGFDFLVQVNYREGGDGGSEGADSSLSIEDSKLTVATNERRCTVMTTSIVL